MVDHRAAHGSLWVSTAAVWMMGALGVQFLFGMYVNLFVSIPMHATALLSPMGSMGGMMNMAGTSPLVMLHGLWGLGLAAGGFIVGMGALAARRAHLVAAAGVGWLAILVAGWAGLQFLMAGQHDAMSYTMAVGWLVAMLAYLVIAREQPAL
ncbi:hypothetical protein [Sulfobacillus harzensis]|uniref:DUF998 domain-containing protein n=1 Tax=Sulfobacillus harzensis TaxID=2729629 RepID=A0A7Y0Q1P4_9FIRM|nr:hypothetical protein [Sulfobacillus harzensis]NMP21530.1 hypothetical protein [Sulfobacillus harzensis]